VTRTTTTGATTFVNRSEAAATFGRSSRSEGLLLCAPAGDAVAALTLTEADAVIELNRDALHAVGVGSSDRMVLALNNDGDAAGGLLARAAAGVAGAVASVGPRGRMRLLRAIRAVEPTTLVMTPCGAADLLARLHLEFLVDPQELGLRRLIVLGEIAGAGTYRHLEKEFDVDLSELWCDPWSGAALASRRPTRDGGFTAVRDDAVGLAPVDGAAGLVEWAVRPVWSSQHADVHMRSGWVAPCADGTQLPAPVHTIGDHVLARGLWLSLPVIDQALRRIDGITSWTLELSRTGTLDHVELHVVLGRTTLVDNPMWAGRIRDAVAGVTPVHVDVHFHDEAGYPHRDQVVDFRGHHLGARRSSDD
jgi:phenylacetate-CoA ligase